MIIGISGKAGCGKSTLAEMLVAALGQDWQRMALGDEVKREAAAMFGFPLVYAYTAQGKDRVVPVGHVISGAETMTVRQILQYWGTDVRREQDQSYWVKALAQRLPAGKHVIVDDIRFVSEVDFIRGMGGKVIRINQYPGYAPPAAGAAHRSETELDDYRHFDLTFAPAFGELRQVAEEVTAYIKKFRTGGVLGGEKFAAGGLIPPGNDGTKVLVDRGWWKCKTCGAVFESYISPPLDHVCPGLMP